MKPHRRLGLQKKYSLFWKKFSKITLSLVFSLILGGSLGVFHGLKAPFLEPFRCVFLEAGGVLFGAVRGATKEIQCIIHGFNNRHQWEATSQSTLQEIQRLQGLLYKMEGVWQENCYLRQQLRFPSFGFSSFVSAFVLTSPAARLDGLFLIKAGKRHGVHRGNSVFSKDYLVGQVEEVGPFTSRVLPLTHPQSRIPVMGIKTRSQGILAGDGTPFPRLMYLKDHEPLKEGELFVTSQFGKHPPGHSVGHTVKDAKGDMRLQPLVSWESLEVVRMHTLARKAPPPPHSLGLTLAKPSSKAPTKPNER